MVACADDSLSRSGSRRNDIVPVNEEEEDPSTVPTTDEEDIPVGNADTWPTAEGYTPLGDMLSMGSVLVAMPPSDNDDQDNENDSNGVTYFSPGPNAFVADPSALFGGNENWNGDTGDDHAESGTNNLEPDEHDITAPTGNSENSAPGEAIDFRDAASSALMALENDYMMTVQGQIRPSLMDAQPPSMATQGPAMSLFGESSLEAPTARNNTANADFFADFDSANASSSISTGNSATHQKEVKEIPKIDSAAVQKAVEGIINNSSDSLGAKLKKWQKEQEQTVKERREQREHEIIPNISLKAFRKTTPRAVQATATLTRAATIAESLHRLSELLQSQECLNIHIVGADHVECQSEDRIRHHFSPLARWVNNNTYSPRNIKMSLVGPNIPSSMASKPNPTNLLNSQPGEDQAVHRLYSAEAKCYEASYHDWLQAKLQQNQDMPDLVVAFNAGIWGYDEWKPTIRCLLNLKDSAVPFLVTSYTIAEGEGRIFFCSGFVFESLWSIILLNSIRLILSPLLSLTDDFDVIQEVVAECANEMKGSILQPKKKMQCIWGPEPNRFASKQKRETATPQTQHYRENAAYQAWFL